MKFGFLRLSCQGALCSPPNRDSHRSIPRRGADNQRPPRHGGQRFGELPIGRTRHCRDDVGSLRTIHRMKGRCARYCLYVLKGVRRCGDGSTPCASNDKLGCLGTHPWYSATCNGPLWISRSLFHGWSRSGRLPRGLDFARPRLQRPGLGAAGSGLEREIQGK